MVLHNLESPFYLSKQLGHSVNNSTQPLKLSVSHTHSPYDSRMMPKSHSVHLQPLLALMETGEQQPRISIS